jgi:hypothetical protein
VFLCVQKLAFLAPSVDKSLEEYCERFQLIFLLPLISSEYVGHFAQHSALDVTLSTDIPTSADIS